MGGKVWSKDEEHVFFDLMKTAPPGLQKESKAAKKGRSDVLNSWRPLVLEMERRMRQRVPGANLPRNYTPISMYEHHFQNIVQGKLSPNAKPYVDKYKIWLKEQAGDPASDSDNEASESRDASAPEESSDGHASHERPSTRPQMASEGCHDSNMTAAPVLVNQNCTPGQHDRSGGGLFRNLPHYVYELAGSRSLLAHQNIGGAKRFAVWTPTGTIYPEPIGMNQASVEHNFSQFAQLNDSGRAQFPPGMPDMQAPLLNRRGQANMGAAFPELITGHHGAHDDADFVVDQNAVQPGYSTFTGSDGAQERMRSDYE